MTNPSVVLNSGGKKFREVIVRFREVIVQQNVIKVVATYVSASSQGQRTHSARTNMFLPAAKGSARTALGPIPKIVATFIYASSQRQRTHSAWTNLDKPKELVIYRVSCK
jgi:hypothetical protein